MHLTAYGKASLYVEAQYNDRFVVKSVDGSDVKFAWQVSALRRGYLRRAKLFEISKKLRFFADEQYRLEQWNNG